jgi:outer membrane protein
VADEVLEQARAAMRPQIGFNGSFGSQELEFGRTVNTPSGSFPLDGRQERATVGLEARQALYAGGGLVAQRSQARAGVDAAAADLRQAEQDVILAVVEAYLDVQRAHREVAIRETNLTSLDEQVRAAGDRFSAGEVTRTDVAQTEARKAAARSDLATSRSQLENARAIYERIVGRPPVQLASPPPAPALPATLDEAISFSRELNPRLVAARAQESAAEQGINIAKAGLLPRLAIVGSGGMQETYQDKTFRDTNLGIFAQLSIPFYEGGVLSSRTRSARLESDRARYNRMAIEREVTAEVTSAWHAVIAAREAIAASGVRVSAADLALEGARQELLVGTRITLDVLDQEREFLEAQLAQVDAERAAYLATHELLRATGRLKVETISQR